MRDATNEPADLADPVSLVYRVVPSFGPRKIRIIQVSPIARPTRPARMNGFPRELGSLNGMGIDP